MMNTIHHPPALEHARLVGRNTIFMLLSGVIGFVVTVVVARVLGPEKLGLYACAVATASLAVILLNDAPVLLISREVARAPTTAGTMVTDVTLMAGMMVIPSFLAAAALALRESNAVLRAGILVAMIPISARALLRYYCSIFQARERMFWTALATAMLAVLTLAGVLIIFAVKPWQNPVAVLVVEGTAAVLVVLTCLPLLARIHDARPRRPSGRRLGRFMIRLAPFWVIVAAGVVLAQCDVFLLSKLGTASETGLYRAAMNVILPFQAIAFLFTVALYPTMARHVQETNLWQAIVWRSFKNSILVGLGITLALSAAAPPLAVTLYGADYKTAGRLLALLSPIVVFRFPAYVLNVTLLALDMERRFAQLMVAIAFINVLMNLILIPRYGAEGAVAACVGTAAIRLVFQLWLVSRSPTVIRFWRLIPSCLAGTATFCVIAFWAPLPLWARLLAASAAYVVVLVTSGAIDRLDLAALRRVCAPGARSGARRE